jgi:hypothetical protein
MTGSSTTQARLWHGAPTVRLWHGALATLGLANIALQMVLTVQQDGGGATTRLVRLFSYFTLVSNVLVVGTAAAIAARPARDGRAWRVLRLDALICIVVTGLVYAVVLRPTVHNEGWAALTDVVFHQVVPVAAVLGWLVLGPRFRIDPRTVAWSLMLPLAWLAYTLAHGAVGGWYPYPFVDAGALGYPQVLLNCLGVTALALLVAGLLAVGDRWLPSAPGTGPGTRRPDHVDSGTRGG